MSASRITGPRQYEGMGQICSIRFVFETCSHVILHNIYMMEELPELRWLTGDGGSSSREVPLRCCESRGASLITKSALSSLTTSFKGVRVVPPDPASPLYF